MEMDQKNILYSQALQFISCVFFIVLIHDLMEAIVLVDGGFSRDANAESLSRALKVKRLSPPIEAPVTDPGVAT